MRRKYNKEIKEKLSRLKRYLIHIHGEENGSKKYTSLTKGNGRKILIFKYGKEEGMMKYQTRIEHDRKKNTLDGFIERYGKEEGVIKYYEKNKKLSVGYDTLKNKGLSDDEIREIKENHSYKSSLKNKYSEEQFTEYVSNMFIPSKLESWLKLGYSEDDARKKVKGSQTRGLDFFIKKYGEVDGTIKYLVANEKRKYANTKEYYIEKYGKENGVKYYNDMVKKRDFVLTKEYWIEKYGYNIGVEKYYKSKSVGFGGLSSKIENKFKTNLINILGDTYNYTNHEENENKIILFGENEFNLKYAIPDLIINENIIIEFDGDYWHSRKIIKDHDSKKDILFNRLGYNVIRVKEKGYKNNELKIIMEIIKKIKKYENKKSE